VGFVAKILIDNCNIVYCSIIKLATTHYFTIQNQIRDQCITHYHSPLKIIKLLFPMAHQATTTDVL
jgi:hypothetical protein